MQSHTGSKTATSPPGTSPPDAALQAALAERERFLARHPHMQAYQDQIDKVLDKSGSHQGRLAVLGMLMQSKLLEMQAEFKKLNAILACVG
jgi:hypothetical protein